MKIRVSYLFICMILMCILNGCSTYTRLNISEGVPTPSAQPQVWCSIQEQVLPEQEESLLESMPIGGYISNEEPVFVGDTMYLTSAVWDEEHVALEGYVQMISAPYKVWSTGTNDVLLESDGKTYSVNKFQTSSAEEVYCTVYCREEEKYYFAKWQGDTLSQLMGLLPDNIKGHTLFVDSVGKVYTYGIHQSEIGMLDEQMQLQEEKTLSGNVLGMIEDTSTNTVYCFGCEGDVVTIWEASTGKAYFTDEGNVSSRAYQAAFTSEGQLYLCDSQGLWRVEDEQVTEVCSFLERDYIVDEVYHVAVETEGTVRLLVSLDGDYCILRVQEKEVAEVPQKQEITVAIYNTGNAGLQKAVARFNRQSDKYQINLVTADNMKAMDDYRLQLQMEVSGGKGPDIISSEILLDMEPYVENGYLVCLDDLQLEEEQYIPATIEANKVDGRLYGVPYECTLLVNAYPTGLIGDKATWTVQDMMEAVKATNAEVLQVGLSGSSIVYYYALADRSDNTYIDWEKGESHLTEAPFLELLEFAKEYAGEYIKMQREGTMLQEGSAVSVSVQIDRIQNMQALNACFGEDYFAWGYPRVDGKGVALVASSFYLNNACESKEGAMEFLKFLTSEEAQKKNVDFFANPEEGVKGARPTLPVHMAAIDYLVAKERKSTETITTTTYSGIEYEYAPLTQKQVEVFYDMLERTYPYKYKTAISEIVFAELPAYFAGEKTAEEVAYILDNRVQLYLDEQK